EKSLIIKHLPLGSEFNIVEVIGKWIKINLPPDKDGIVITGYVQKSFVEFEEKIDKTNKQDVFSNISQVEEPQLPYKQNVRKIKNKRAWAGIKFGINSSNIDVSGEDSVGMNWQSQNYIAIGGFVVLNINENISLQHEIFYLRKGAKYSGTVLGTNFGEEFNGKYIEMPILIAAKFPVEKKLGLGIFVGPYGAINLGAKRKIVIGGNLNEENFEEIKDQDFGFVFGGGLEFKFSLGLITLDVRYSLGLSNVYKPIESEDIIVKTRAFLVLIGIGF
ncbi:MAG: outer membrane beta-barrel protein, partial [Candidatus Helarchaeota archaeon]